MARFLQDNRIEHCQAAKKVIEAGKSNYKGEESSKNFAKRVFEVYQALTTTSDMIEMGNRRVDMLAPCVRDSYSVL